MRAPKIKALRGKASQDAPDWVTQGARRVEEDAVEAQDRPSVPDWVTQGARRVTTPAGGQGVPPEQMEDPYIPNSEIPQSSAFEPYGQVYDPQSGTYEMVPESQAGMRRAMETGEDTLRSAASGAWVGLNTIPNLAMAPFNFIGRANPFYYEDGLYRGDYNDPFETRDQTISRLRDVGVLAEEPYQPATMPGRFANVASEAGAQGGVYGLGRKGASTLARMAGDRMIPRAAQGGTAANLGREIIEEVGTGVAAATGSQAAMESDQVNLIPGAPAIAGLITGLTAGRTLMSNTNARQAIRSNVQVIPDEVYQRADEIAQRSRGMGVTIGADEAIIEAADELGVDVGEFRALAQLVRRQGVGGRPMREMEAGRIVEPDVAGDPITGSVGDALNRLADPVQSSDVGADLQRVGGDIVARRRGAIRERLRPEFEAGAQQPLGESGDRFVRDLDQRLEDIASNANVQADRNMALRLRAQLRMPEAGEPDDLRRALEAAGDDWSRITPDEIEALEQAVETRPLISTAGQLYDWERETNRAINAATTPNSTGRAQRPEWSGLFGSLRQEVAGEIANNYQQLGRAREATRRMSERLVDPVQETLNRISDPQARRDAQNVLDTIGRQSETANLPRFRRGFRIIAAENPQLAKDAMNAFIQSRVDRVVRGASSPAQTNNIGQAAYTALIANDGPAIRTMMNALDEGTGMAEGVRFDAFRNAMRVMRSTTTRGSSRTSPNPEELGRSRSVAGGLQNLAGGLGSASRAQHRFQTQASYEQIGRAFANPDNVQYIRELARSDPNSYRARYLVATMIGLGPDEIDPNEIEREAQAARRQQEDMEATGLRLSALGLR